MYSVWHLVMQLYGKNNHHSEPVFSKMAKPTYLWTNKNSFALWTVCSVQKIFCLIVGLASWEKTGSETGKI